MHDADYHYDWSPCRHCGQQKIEDPWELTGMLIGPGRIYPLTLAGPKGAMNQLWLHKACITPFFEYLTESMPEYIGDLCREQQDCAA